MITIQDLGMIADNSLLDRFAEPAAIRDFLKGKEDVWFRVNESEYSPESLLALHMKDFGFQVLTNVYATLVQVTEGDDRVTDNPTWLQRYQQLLYNHMAQDSVHYGRVSGAQALRLLQAFLPVSNSVCVPMRRKIS